MTITESPTLETALNEGLKRFKVPGASLAVLRDGKVERAVGGVLNVDSGHAVTPDSLFQIGSITKVFTAHLVMQLADEGRLDLDAPVVDVLTDFQCADREARGAITTRQLLNHTSGLGGDYFSDTGQGEEALKRYIDRCALLPQAHAPGKGFSYCNSGFGLAGRLIEVVTGRGWDANMYGRIFGPLGMRRSGTTPAALVGHPVALGHSLLPDGRLVAQASNYGLPVSGAPAGATCSMSTADLMRFVQAHLDGGAGPEGARVLSEDSVRLMQTRTVDMPAAARDITGWGLGWFMGDWEGSRLIGHDGGTSGQASFLRVNPANRSAVALFTNGGEAHALMDWLFRAVAEEVLGGRMPRDPEPVDRLPMDAETVCGHYRSVSADTRIALEDGRMVRRHQIRVDQYLAAEPEVEMKHVAGDTWLYRRSALGAAATVTFLDRDADGRPRSLFSGIRLLNRV